MNVITPPLLLPSSWPPGGGEAQLAFAHRLRLPSFLLEAKLDGCSLQEEGNPSAFSHKTRVWVSNICHPCGITSACVPVLWQTSLPSLHTVWEGLGRQRSTRSTPGGSPPSTSTWDAAAFFLLLFVYAGTHAFFTRGEPHVLRALSSRARQTDSGMILEDGW